jgi:hypothetical protein
MILQEQLKYTTKHPEYYANNLRHMISYGHWSSTHGHSFKKNNGKYIMKHLMNTI